MLSKKPIQKKALSFIKALYGERGLQDVVLFITVDM